MRPTKNKLKMKKLKVAKETGSHSLQPGTKQLHFVEKRSV